MRLHVLGRLGTLDVRLLRLARREGFASRVTGSDGRTKEVFDMKRLAEKLGHDGVWREARNAMVEAKVDPETIGTAFKMQEMYEAKAAADAEIKEVRL
jgi:hypothetical protein